MSEEKTLIDDLFEGAEVGTLSETLPSRGKLYPGHTGTVTIEPMTYEDELALAKSNSTNIVDILINRCVDKVDVSDLMPIDKLFLIYKIRECPFGS